MPARVVQFHDQLGALQQRPTDEDVQATTQMLAAAGEFHFVEQPPNQRLTTAAAFLKQSRQPGRAAVDMVLDDRAVGEELILAEVALAVGLCDQCA